MVGVHHTLRQPGSSRGVHDVQHVIGCCIDLRFSGGLGVAERAVVFSKVGNLVGLRDLQPMLDVGFVTTTMQIRDSLDKFVIENQPLSATVFQNELQFVGYKRQFNGTTTAPILASA